MDRDRVRNWMWSEACEMLARAERLHHEFFKLGAQVARHPAWEPPADVFETEGEVVVLVALPGVEPDKIQMAIDGNHLVVAGTRTIPAALRQAVIHRLELPQGRFERRIPLPSGRYGSMRPAKENGLLVVFLNKQSNYRG
jgi:HSP20 family molecular chaperone IbpA